MSKIPLAQLSDQEAWLNTPFRLTLPKNDPFNVLGHDEVFNDESTEFVAYQAEK